jgi:tRNA pseudouridine55 synthase
MLLLIDKPAWYTCWDIIRKLKKLYPKVKIWHSWTLDPMATGLLIIWLWKDTKKLSYFQKLPKEYETIIDFSLETDTWDKDRYNWYKKYKVTKQWLVKEENGNNIFVKKPELDQIKEKLQQIKGEVVLPLPPFSAKKIKWQRLYDLARQWKIENLEKKMMIYDYKILWYDFPYLRLWLKVWSWTYIRSIWYWLWKQFDLWGSLVYLRRLAIGSYRI